MSLHRSL